MDGFTHVSVFHICCDFERPFISTYASVYVFVSGLYQPLSSDVHSDQMPAPPCRDQRFSRLLPALPWPKGTNYALAAVHRMLPQNEGAVGG